MPVPVTMSATTLAHGEANLSAGFPSPAADHGENRIDLAEILVPHPSATFTLRINGHSMTHGFREGRDPSASFDTSFYLESNPDVLAAGMNPLDHYNFFGRSEGRLPTADTSSDEGDETPVIPPTDPQSPWVESAPTIFARIYSPNGGSYDFRNGGWANDVIIGTSQNEYFDINYGFDTLTGGGGSDVFAFNSATDNDTITDFDPRNDFLDLGYWATTSSTSIYETGTGSSVIQIIDSRSTITLTGVTVDDWSLIRDADHGVIFG